MCLQRSSIERTSHSVAVVEQQSGASSLREDLGLLLFLTDVTLTLPECFLHQASINKRAVTDLLALKRDLCILPHMSSVSVQFHWYSSK